MRFAGMGGRLAIGRRLATRLATCPTSGWVKGIKKRMVRKMNRTLVVAGMLLTVSVVRAQINMSLKPTGSTGQVSGTIRDDAGQPVSGANVMVARTYPITGIAGPRAFFTTTDGQGRYQVANLPPALYKTCPSAPGLTLLDPCIWSA